jgi:hypothetical protein
MIFFKNSWAAMVPLPQELNPMGYLNTVEDLGFLKATEPIFASFKRNIPGG